MSSVITRRVTRAVAVGAAVAAGALGLAGTASAATETFSGTAVPSNGWIASSGVQPFKTLYGHSSTGGYVGCELRTTAGVSVSSAYGYGVCSLQTTWIVPVVAYVVNVSGAPANLTGVAET